MIQELTQPGLGRVTVQGNPIKMSMTNPRPRGPAPKLGGNTFEILNSILDISKEEFNEYRENGVV
jgi:crotonobetainyl-CoA:carnitine CoA-transferase CaiB-like acyl-CoA transferase